MLHTLSDIAGADSAVSINPGSPTMATWVQLIISGAGTVRIGGNEVTVSRGAAIPAGGSQFLPYKGRADQYLLSQIYCYIPTGATVSVLYDA